MAKSTIEFFIPGCCAIHQTLNVLISCVVRFPRSAPRNKEQKNHGERRLLCFSLSALIGACVMVEAISFFSVAVIIFAAAADFFISLEDSVDLTLVFCLFVLCVLPF